MAITLGDAIQFFQAILPNNLQELFLFVITVVLVVIIVELFNYTGIQRRIKNESRCYRDRVLNRQGVGIFTAKARSKDGEDIYEIKYDFGAKTYTITQLAKAGPVQNKIVIPVYDLRTNTPTEVVKYFECEKDFGTSQGVIYTGYTGIVKFMQYNNMDFFDKMVEG
jgi:hypothetical protein